MTAPTYFTDVEINGRWRLQLPDFRALRYATAGPLGWERERIASMHVNLDGNDTLLDVGAESGDMTALFARWVRDVQIIEPNPVAWPNIKAIFAVNGLTPPAAHWVGFAADITEDAPLGVPDPFGSGWPACATGDMVAAHGFLHMADLANVDTTSSITVDEFVARASEAPTAITIDVEGAELHVLKGAARLLAEHRPLLWVSVHPAQLRQHFRERPADVYAYLEAAGYRVTHLADDHEVHIMAEPR